MTTLLPVLISLRGALIIKSSFGPIVIALIRLFLFKVFVAEVRALVSSEVLLLTLYVLVWVVDYYLFVLHAVVLGVIVVTVIVVLVVLLSVVQRLNMLLHIEACLLVLPRLPVQVIQDFQQNVGI